MQQCERPSVEAQRPTTHLKEQCDKHKNVCPSLHYHLATLFSLPTHSCSVDFARSNTKHTWHLQHCSIHVLSAQIGMIPFKQPEDEDLRELTVGRHLGAPTISLQCHLGNRGRLRVGRAAQLIHHTHGGISVLGSPMSFNLEAHRCSPQPLTAQLPSRTRSGQRPRPRSAPRAEAPQPSPGPAAHTGGDPGSPASQRRSAGRPRAGPPHL